MSSTKNPEHEAEHPAPMPKGQQGQGGDATPWWSSGPTRRRPRRQEARCRSERL